MIVIRPRPAPGAAKKRLRATLREIDRMVQGLPEGICDLVDKVGLFSAWRQQVGTLSRITNAADALLALGRAVRS